MPIRINEITSNIQITGEKNTLSQTELLRIVNIVLEEIRKEQEHEKRVSEEREIKKQISDIDIF